LQQANRRPREAVVRALRRYGDAALLQRGRDGGVHLPAHPQQQRDVVVKE